MIVSPNPALRIGLRELLSAYPEELEVLGEAADLDILDLGTEPGDVLILAAVSVLPELVEDGPPILLLTDDPIEAQALASSALSAWGVLSSNAGEEELSAAVRALAEGLSVGTPSLMRGLMRKPLRMELVNGEEEVLEALTARETQVLQMLAQGLANKQIALALEISEHTVKFHVSSIYSKLNASSRTEAVNIGLRSGLISL